MPGPTAGGYHVELVTKGAELVAWAVVDTLPTMIEARMRSAEPLVPYWARTPGAGVASDLAGKL